MSPEISVTLLFHVRPTRRTICPAFDNPTKAGWFAEVDDADRLSLRGGT